MCVHPTSVGLWVTAGCPGAQMCRQKKKKKTLCRPQLVFSLPTRTCRDQVSGRDGRDRTMDPLTVSKVKEGVFRHHYRDLLVTGVSDDTL